MTNVSIPAMEGGEDPSSPQQVFRVCCEERELLNTVFLLSKKVFNKSQVSKKIFLYRESEVLYLG